MERAKHMYPHSSLSWAEIEVQASLKPLLDKVRISRHLTKTAISGIKKGGEVREKRGRGERDGGGSRVEKVKRGEEEGRREGEARRENREGRERGQKRH